MAEETKDNRQEIKRRYEERKAKLRKQYNSYYRINQDYIQTIFLHWLSGSFEKKPLRKGGEEKLTIFQGRITDRFKVSKKLYEAKYDEYWLYTTIALQNTVMDSIIAYADDHGIDILEVEWIKVKLKFYSGGKHSRCKIFSLEKTTQQELLVQISEKAKSSLNEITKPSLNDVTK